MIMARMTKEEMSQTLREIKVKAQTLQDMFYTLQLEYEEKATGDAVSYETHASLITIDRNIIDVRHILNHLSNIRIPE